ncbi:hypothetical protein OK006_7109 [Actinobacteria bacterium OK006]|nr:hypothetical protein OK006_7109 [Actinobacteria bacterium OK006]
MVSRGSLRLQLRDGLRAFIVAECVPGHRIVEVRLHLVPGTDPDGNAYIAIAGAEDHYLTDTREALRTMILGIKAGSADHLL